MEEIKIQEINHRIKENERKCVTSNQFEIITKQIQSIMMESLDYKNKLSSCLHSQKDIYNQCDEIQRKIFMMDVNPQKIKDLEINLDKANQIFLGKYEINDKETKELYRQLENFEKIVTEQIHILTEKQ